MAAAVRTSVETYETASFQESRRKAELGNPTAQYDLAEDYYFGHAVLQDYQEALAWFRKAAEQGHVQAQANLGMMYALGRGAERDEIEAFKWISLAAAKGNPSALKTQDILVRRITLEQQSEARRRAGEFAAEKLPRHSEP